MTTSKERTVPTSPAHFRAAYWTVGVTYVVLQAFMTVPSPLYAVYAQRDHLSSLTITLIYAAYAIGVVVSLVLAGHLSDSLGRRPLLFSALALAAASALVFVVWPALPGLVVARMVSGLAVGVTASTATAYLNELFLAHRPADQLHRAQLLTTGAALGGLGVGGLVAGVLAQYAGHPLVLPYLVMLGLFALCIVGVALGPETRRRRVPRPPYRPQRLAVPPHARGAFAAALTGVAAQFALFGLFVGLAGTFVSVVLHRHSLALSGLVLFIVFAAGVACATLTATLSRAVVAVTALVLMLVGLAVLVLAAWLPDPSLGVFLVGGALIGAGGAALFKVSLGVAIVISPPERAAESLATFFLAGYLGLSVPVIGIGIALQHVATKSALLGFAVVIAIGVLLAAPKLARVRTAG